MIEEFERLLAEGGGTDQLEQVRNRLKRGVEDARQARLAQIEADYKTCQLIMYGLNQRHDSISYGIARGFVRWLQKEYPNDSDLARDLMRDIRRQEYEEKQKKGDESHDKHRNERTAEDPESDNTGDTRTACSTNTERVPKGIQGGES